MSLLRSSPEFGFDLTLYSMSWVHVMMRQWHIVSGIDVVDFDLLLQSIAATGGTSPGVALRPCLQYAPIRTDRPDDPFVLTVATADATSLTPSPYFHFQETLVTATANAKFLVRGGISAKLTASAGTATLGRAMGTLAMNWRSLGVLLSPDELDIGPFPASATDKLVFPLGGGAPNIASKIAGVRFAMYGTGANPSGGITLQPMARFYNDPNARGDWTLIGSPATPTGTDWGLAPPSTEVTFSGFTTTNFQFFDLAMAVWKSATNARALVYVNTALRYT